MWQILETGLFTLHFNLFSVPCYGYTMEAVKHFACDLGTVNLMHFSRTGLYSKRKKA